MSEDEKTYSFMNNYLIFKKVGSPAKGAIVTGVVDEVLTPIVEETIKVPIIKKPIALKKSIVL